MTIGIWGDSITFGSCDSEGLGWVGRLRKTLPSDDNHQLYNFGVCGENTQDLLKRFAVEASATEPDKVIFAIGINDSKLPSDSNQNNVSVETFKINLKELIGLAKCHTGDVVLIGLTRIDTEWRSQRGSIFLNDEINKYDKTLRDLANELSLLYIPMFDILNTITDLADGLHPNASGYQKMFNAIQSQVRIK